MSFPDARAHGYGPGGRDGFTLVEVIVATLILAVGVIGLASSTGFLVRQVTAGEMATQRAAAFQIAIERLRALDWESVGTGSANEGRYAVNWWVAQEYAQSRVVKIVTRGPGLVTTGTFPSLHPNVSDTFTYRLLRH
jgi:prepilin-type N-terminal cleavage/methylation domain-containing protein